MNENLKGLFYSILIVFTGYVITILSIYLDYFGNEVVAIVDKTGILIMVIAAISTSRYLSKIDKFP